MESVSLAGTMLPRLCVSVLICGTLPVGGSTAAQPVDGALRYAGTAGQQRVTMVLEVAGDAVRGGHYHYDGQRSEIGIVDSRQFGTTVVLQDEDGNILHLHFQDAAGAKTGSLGTAAMLEGTLDRGEQDLPVRLTRLGRESSLPDAKTAR